MKKITCLAAVLALVTTACGTHWAGNYTGSLTGTAANTALTNTTFAMTLYQTGSDVKGYWIATGPTAGLMPTSGWISGGVSGNTLTAALEIPTGETNAAPGAGIYNGNLTLNEGTLSGVVTGTQTLPISGAVTAILNLTQQR